MDINGLLIKVSPSPPSTLPPVNSEACITLEETNSDSLSNLILSSQPHSLPARKWTASLSLSHIISFPISAKPWLKNDTVTDLI